VRVRFASAVVTPVLIEKSGTAPPPLSVTRPPPSRLVFTATVLVLVKVIVTGLAPQLKVMLPPAASATPRAASVQLPEVPVPTTTGAVMSNEALVAAARPSGVSVATRV
jgi:hypothetical protein